MKGVVASDFSFIFIKYIMPKLLMKLQNPNAFIQSRILRQNIASPKPTVAIVKPRVSIGLNSSMVGRIHNVRPGCGSCGH